jgi:hypothetical protein
MGGSSAWNISNGKVVVLLHQGPGLISSTRCSTNTSLKPDVVTALQKMSFVQVSIIAVTLQSLLTGAYFASFLMCLRWLVFSDDGGTLRKGINWPLLSIAIILFTFSVVDLGFSVQTMLLISENRSGKANRAVIAVRNSTI